MIHQVWRAFNPRAVPAHAEIPLNVPGVAKSIAVLRGIGFHESIRASEHLRHTPPAIGFDSDLLARAEALGAATARVTDLENWARDEQPSEMERRATERKAARAKRAAEPVQMGLW